MKLLILLCAKIDCEAIGNAVETNPIKLGFFDIIAEEKMTCLSN